MKMRRRGFTLAEVIVMSLIFSIFSATAVAGLTLALRYYRQTNERMLAEQNARVAMQTVMSEARQAIIDPDAGGAAQPTGYKSITPTVAATGFLTPNANVTNSNSLVFTEPSSTYDLTVSGFSDTAPQNYQRVNYYVTNNALHRQVITYTSSGGVQATDDSVVVAASSTGSLVFGTQYLSPTSVRIQITAVEAVYSYSLAVTVTMVGQ